MKNYKHIAVKLAKCLRKYQARYHATPHAQRDWDESEAALKEFGKLNKTKKTTMKKTNEQAPAIDGAFLAMIQNHRRGEALSDLAEAMREVTEAAQLTGKGAVLTLKIKVKPASKGGAMVVVDEIKMTLPKAEAEGSIFFADEAGNLLREDPNQKTLPLRSIEGGQAEITVPLKKVAGQS
jgi:hypothetical protein